MENLLKLKEKYMKVDCNKLENLLKDHLKTINETEKIQSQLDEGLLGIEEQISRLTLLENDYKHQTEILAKKSNEASEWEGIIEKLEIQHETAVCDNRELESQKIQLSQKQMNPLDLKKIDIERRKIALYKEFTRTHWDYEAPQDTCKGYINNRVDYIQAFEYIIRNHEKHLDNILWNEIYLSTQSNGKE